jgi:hypothetical protein
MVPCENEPCETKPCENWSDSCLPGSQAHVHQFVANVVNADWRALGARGDRSAYRPLGGGAINCPSPSRHVPLAGAGALPGEIGDGSSGIGTAEIC